MYRYHIARYVIVLHHKRSADILAVQTSYIGTMFLNFFSLVSCETLQRKSAREVEI